MGLPEYPESREILIEDQKLFEEKFSSMKTLASDYKFTNLFLWGKARGYSASMLDGHILVFYEKEGKKFFFQPMGPEAWKVIKSVLDKEPEATFVRVTEEGVKNLEGLRVEEDRDNFDYVYEREKLVKLDGAKFYPKRSFAEKAMKYNPEIRETCEEGCLELQDEWCRERECKLKPELNEENTAVYTLFMEKKDLWVSFVSIVIDGKVAAFAAGEELNKDTFVVWFEKGNTKYKGIYQLINREFAKRIPEKYKYINREQDLGIEGLRKAKLSYYPACMVKKYTVRK
ncbi:MAG: DUF2156 domain-containing protein [Candidatus Aenigmatarchaeota archaeon]|nr:MAG: DUF2156 domain-containing protein [Candidatus Aenigmarchaeota archaeon]